MSEQNSTLISENSCSIKEETDKCPDLNSIQLDFIKNEIPTNQENDDNNQPYRIEDSNVINTANNIALESFEVNAVNVPKIKTERDDRYTDTQNSMVIIEDSFLLKVEIDIKKEILTCLNNDGSNEAYTENITVNNDQSNNIPIDTLNACSKIKTENDCENTIIQNSILIIEDGYSIKVENDSFPNTNSSLLCSTYEENTSFRNNEDNNPSHYSKEFFNKIEQMSPECCDIFKENIYEVKTEIDNNINNFETSMNDLKSDEKDVKKHNTIQLKSTTNCDRKPHKSDICQISLTEKRNFEQPMFIDTVEKPHKCDICQKSFSLKKYLNGHMITHTGKKPYKCNICQKSFSRKNNLKTHILTHTDEKPHKCNICQKSFPAKRSLKQHMFTHTGEKPQKCDLCQKSFSTKQSLKNHMSTHTGKTPYKCDICQKPYSVKAYLKYHMLTHTGEKRHRCNICQKTFLIKHTLQNHMLTHTGEKRHKCNYCQKSFIAKRSLKQHMFIHTGKKPHECNICEKSFLIKQSLQNHMFTHTDKNPH